MDGLVAFRFSEMSGVSIVLSLFRSSLSRDVSLVFIRFVCRVTWYGGG